MHALELPGHKFQKKKKNSFHYMGVGNQTQVLLHGEQVSLTPSHLSSPSLKFPFKSIQIS